MHRTVSRTVLAPFAVALVLAALASPIALRAQESSSSTAIAIGIYDPQRIAEETGLQQQVMQQMQGLQQRAQQAQQDADQGAMQQIQLEARQLQQEAAAQFAADLETVMPGVAAAAGVQVITTEVSWAAAGVETRDVTDAIIAAMAPAADGE